MPAVSPTFGVGCGLGMLDETEAEPLAQPAAVAPAAVQPLASKAAAADLGSAIRQALAGGWSQSEIQAEMQTRYSTTSSRNLTTDQARELAAYLVETLDGGAPPAEAAVE